MTDHWQADTTVTYFLISAVGENIQYQHNSSSGISIFWGITSHFIPIQWHSKLSILDTEQQIYSNIRDLKQDNAAAVTLLLSLCLLIMRMRKRWDDHMVNQQSKAAEKEVEGLMKMAEASSSLK